MVWRAEYFLSPLLLTTVWGSLVVFPVTVQVTEMWPFIEPFFSRNRSTQGTWCWAESAFRVIGLGAGNDTSVQGISGWTT